MKIKRLFTKTQYAVAYRFSSEGILADTKTSFSVLMPTKEQWYADPFIVNRDGRTYVFMEVFMNDKGYAGIGYSELVDGKLDVPQIVIDEKYHMSFPGIITHNGKTYMIPETEANYRIQMFECERFPDIWIPKMIVDEGKYDDTSFYKYNGESYAFSSQPTEDIYGSTLYLLKLDSSLKMIDKKQISQDYRFSRQAGNVFERSGKLIRAAQNCSDRDYGHCLEFLTIENPDFDNYKETHLKSVLPEEIRTDVRVHGIAGVHTYNREGNFEVIDLKLCTFSAKSALLKFKIVAQMLADRIKKK